MRYNPLTVHHLLPQSWGWTSHANNTRSINEKTHRAIHTVFQDDTPITQIRRLLKLNWKTLNIDAYHVINWVLRQYEGILEIEAYDPKSVNPDSFITRLRKNETQRN